MNGEPASMAEVEQAATAFVQGLLERLDLPASVTSTETDDETILVSVQGEGLGLLIGHRGQALSALQEVTRTVVQRQVGSYQGRLVVDVGSYRQHRAEALARFSRQVAEQVLASGVPRVLEPMAPSDRKVVHDTLSAVPGVATSSEGEEPRRRVVVSPDPAG